MPSRRNDCGIANKHLRSLGHIKKEDYKNYFLDIVIGMPTALIMGSMPSYYLSDLVFIVITARDYQGTQDVVYGKYKLCVLSLWIWQIDSTSSQSLNCEMYLYSYLFNKKLIMQKCMSITFIYLL